MDTGFFTPDVEFVPTDQGHRQDERSVNQGWTRVSATVLAAVAVSGVLTFCSPPADLTSAELNVASVREARPAPRPVPISPEHLKMIENYRARHVAIPRTDADRRIHPDYDI